MLNIVTKIESVDMPSHLTWPFTRTRAEKTYRYVVRTCPLKEYHLRSKVSFDLSKIAVSPSCVQMTQQSVNLRKTKKIPKHSTPIWSDLFSPCCQYVSHRLTFPLFFRDRNPGKSENALHWPCRKPWWRAPPTLGLRWEIRGIRCAMSDSGRSPQRFCAVSSPGWPRRNCGWMNVS